MERYLAMITLGALLLLPGGGGGAQAQEVPCVQTDTLKEALTLVYPGADIADLKGGAAALYVGGINKRFPNRTPLIADRILIVVLEDGVLAGLSVGGKVCKRIYVGMTLHMILSASSGA